MKYRFLQLFVVIAMLLQACKKESDFAQPVNLTYQLEVDPSVVAFTVPFEKANVVLTNKMNNENYSAKVSTEGQVSFNGIVPGTYSINVSLIVTAEEFTALTGTWTEEDFHLNYSADNLTYYNTNTSSIQLITSQPLEDFVIKQIYFPGSNVSKGASFRDQFYEIYNNSNKVLYADSLCFALVYGKTSNNTGDYLLPNLQYDWAKSLNMSPLGNANADYVYAKAIFMIPSNGRGDAYPVQPGQSIVVAGTAIDHTKPYALNSDKVQAIEDATLTVDLSKADFEVYMVPYLKKIKPNSTPFASDIDNPSVPDVEVIFATGMNDLIMSPQGKESYVIFKTDGNVDPNDFPRYAEPTRRTLTDATVLYPQVPTKYILDAVEASSILEKDQAPRRLSLRSDAGRAAVTGGPYSSQSIIRKTKKTVNGKRILEDTNNSSYDFGFLLKADPSKGSTSFFN